MTSLSSSWRRRTALPALIGFLVAVGTACVAWLLVRGEAARWARMGMSAGPEVKLVVAFSGAAGISAFYLARRLIGGAAVKLQEWTLVVPKLAPQATGYREASAPSIGDLVARLEKHGYQLTAMAVDLEGSPKGAMDPRTALSGAALALTDERLGAPPAGLVVRIAERTETATGLCMLEARDARGAGYAELASFVIVELDALTPGVTYKRSDSVLTPDPAAELRPLLPAKPQALAGR